MDAATPRRTIGGLDVDPDVTRAATLPAAAYHDPSLFERVKERVFARTWHLVGDALELAAPGDVKPVTLLPGCLDEPLLLARDVSGALRCLSNVCTHRGALLVERAESLRALRCPYHGRRFALDGAFLAHPGFEGCRDFPSASDDLPQLPLQAFGRLLFAGLDPAFPLGDALAPLADRIAWLDLDGLRFDGGASHDYEIAASWALYCDNYLEGFHIPHVHPSLARTLDPRAYPTELFEHGVLSLGIARPGEPAFALPAGHPDRELRVGAYYFWLFPTTMLNFYPWGLSINAVEPLAPDRTRIRFLSYVGDEEQRGVGAGAGLHQVEMEDEAVVLSVQRGMRSRLYRRGRYAPAHEAGVHRFHVLLARFLGE